MDARPAKSGTPVSGLMRRLPEGSRRALQLAIAGTCVGLVAVAFHYTVELLHDWGISRLAHQGAFAFIAGSFACVLGASLLASLLINRVAPEAGGGGVMPTKLAFWQHFGVMPLRIPLVKFIASALTLGGGVSMGPEGPSVQIGAGLASSMGSWFGVAKQERRILCACGAAAALAAAFNAPLAAIFFVLEEIIGDLNSRLISGVLLASVCGALVAHAFIGAQPAYQVAALGDASWRGLLLCFLVSVLATTSGVLFQKGAMRLRGATKRSRGTHYGWLTPLLGALVSWMIACALFLHTGHLGIFGIGYEDVTKALEGGLTWANALLLWLGKLAATLFAVGLGGCGGIFAPSIFIGAMTGACVAALASGIMPLSASDSAMLIMAGMCACLGAVIRTPLTCVFLIFEVTHQFAILPLLLVATLVSQLLSRRLHAEGMYEEMMIQDGMDPQRILPPRDFKRWRMLPAASIACWSPICASDLSGEGLTTLLSAHRHARFPALGPDGNLLGILTRTEARQALDAHRTPRLLPAHWVAPSTPLFEAQTALLDAQTDFVCVGQASAPQSFGILTLHDFLRAQSRLDEEAAT